SRSGSGETRGQEVVRWHHSIAEKNGPERAVFYCRAPLRRMHSRAVRISWNAGSRISSLKRNRFAQIALLEFAHGPPHQPIFVRRIGDAHTIRFKPAEHHHVSAAVRQIN